MFMVFINHIWPIYVQQRQVSARSLRRQEARRNHFPTGEASHPPFEIRTRALPATAIENGGFAAIWCNFQIWMSFSGISLDLDSSVCLSLSDLWCHGVFHGLFWGFNHQQYGCSPRYLDCRKGSPSSTSVSVGWTK